MMNGNEGNESEQGGESSFSCYEFLISSPEYPSIDNDEVQNFIKQWKLSRDQENDK